MAVGAAAKGVRVCKKALVAELTLAKGLPLAAGAAAPSWRLLRQDWAACWAEARSPACKACPIFAKGLLLLAAAAGLVALMVAKACCAAAKSPPCRAEPKAFIFCWRCCQLPTALL